jgi:hypothetical protein
MDIVIEVVNDPDLAFKLVSEKISTTKSKLLEQYIISMASILVKEDKHYL